MAKDPRDRLRRAEKKDAATATVEGSLLPGQRAFLAALATTGVVTAAAMMAKVSRASAYRWRQDSPEFEAAWREAMEEAADGLVEEAHRRALEGIVEPVLHQGRPVTVWVDAQGQYVLPGTEGAKEVPLLRRAVSDTLLIFLIKGVRPEVYRERHDHRHSGPEGGPVRAVQRDYEQLRKLPPAELLRMYHREICRSYPVPPGAGSAR